MRMKLSLLVLAASALVSVATSPTDPHPNPDTGWDTADLWWADVWSDVVLYNDSDESRTLRLRYLRDDVSLDCAAVGADPGRLLTSAVFQTAVVWEIPPHVVISASNGSWRDCNATLVEGEGMEPVVLFWNSLESRSWPGRIETGDELRAWDGVQYGGITVRSDGTLSDAFDIASEPDWSESDGSFCALPDNASRVTWSGAPVGLWTLTGVEHGPDGCSALDLSGTPGATRWYLCASQELFPFLAGDVVNIARTYDGIQVMRTDANGGYTGFEVATSTSLPSFADDSGTAPCVAAVTECGTATGALDVRIAGQLAGAGPIEFERNGDTVTVALTWAQHRVVVVPECDRGSDFVGPEYEWTTVVRHSPTF